MYRDYVESLNVTELAEHVAANGVNDFHDLHFKDRILGNAVSFHAEQATVEIHPNGFNYREPTDEGYRSVEVTWCEDDCDENAYSQRDVYAEAMGY
jgi:hypothetical protein